MLSLRHLTFVDPREDVIAELRTAFQGETRVTCVVGRFEDLPEYDCFVSAANSFGMMDGGVDAAITRYFGTELMARVQARIREEWLGEQPIGTSFIEPTGNATHPYLAHSPTMRVPLDIRNTDNVYNAMFATFRAVEWFNKPARRISTLACPGLGTFTGKVSPRAAAQQMALAFQCADQPFPVMQWESLKLRQRLIDEAKRE